MAGKPPPQPVDWETFVTRIARYLSEAKEVATNYKANHSIFIPKFGPIPNESELEDLKATSARLESSLHRIESFPHTPNFDSEADKNNLKLLSELQAEVTQMQRTIATRQGELKDIRSRLYEIRDRVPPEGGAKPNQDPLQRQRLNELFQEYSTIWRNICFVEHHLHRIKTIDSFH